MAGGTNGKEDTHKPGTHYMIMESGMRCHQKAFRKASACASCGKRCQGGGARGGGFSGSCMWHRPVIRFPAHSYSRLCVAPGALSGWQLGVLQREAPGIPPGCGPHLLSPHPALQRTGTACLGPCWHRLPGLGLPLVASPACPGPAPAGTACLLWACPC